MKLLILVAGFVLVPVLAQQQNVTKIERLLYDKCRMFSTDSSAFDLIKEDLSTFRDFQTYASSFLGPGKKQFCNDERPNLIEIMRKLARDMRPCFINKEAYLPRFLFESFVQAINFICSERNMENLFSTQGKECLGTLRQAGAGEEVGNCFRKFIAPFDSVVKKEELCHDLKSAKTCFGESLTRHCPNFLGYVDLNEKFFDAIRKPCNSNASATFGLNSLLLIGAFIWTKVFL